MSNRFNTTPFSPHLTLGRLLDDSSEEALISLKDRLGTSKFEEIAADSGSLVCSESPYQNLVLGLKNSASLERLQAEIESFTSKYSRKAKEEYHISLMYGSVMCNKLQRETAELIDRLPDQVRFFRVSAIELYGAPESWRSVWSIDLK